MRVRPKKTVILVGPGNRRQCNPQCIMSCRTWTVASQRLDLSSGRPKPLPPSRTGCRSGAGSYKISEPVTRQAGQNDEAGKSIKCQRKLCKFCEGPPRKPVAWYRDMPTQASAFGGWHPCLFGNSTEQRVQKFRKLPGRFPNLSTLDRRIGLFIGRHNPTIR